MNQITLLKIAVNAKLNAKTEIACLMSGSCHIGRVEIVVELGIFVFF